MQNKALFTAISLVLIVVLGALLPIRGQVVWYGQYALLLFSVFFGLFDISMVV